MNCLHCGSRQHGKGDFTIRYKCGSYEDGEFFYQSDICEEICELRLENRRLKTQTNQLRSGMAALQSEKAELERRLPGTK